MVRGLELVLGGLLIASGLVGPVGDGQLVSVGDQNLEGVVHFQEWSYNGSSQTTTQHAALRAAGTVDVAVHGSVVVEVFGYQEIHQTAFDTEGHAEGVYQWDYGVKWNTGVPTRVARDVYMNSTLRLTGEPDGRFYAWPTGDAPATFSLAMQNQTNVNVAPSPITPSWQTRDGGYPYLLEAPLFVLGHDGSTEPYGVPVSNVSFDRLDGTGAIELFLEGSGSVEVQTEYGTQTYTTWERDGAQVQTPDGPHQASTELSYESHYVRVTLQDAEFSLGFADIESVFQFRQAVWDVNGTVDFTTQEGWVRTDGSNHTLEGDRVRIEGDTTLGLQATGMGTLAQDLGILTTPNTRTADEPLVDGEVHGDPRHVSINGTPVLSATTRTAPPPVSLEEATLIAKILGGLLIAWGVARTALPLVVGMVAKKPLKHPRRREVFTFLKATGMAHLSELSRATGIPRGSLEYHLMILRQARLVSHIHLDGYHVYFLSTSDFCRDELMRLALLTDPNRRRICEILVAEAAVSQNELVQRLGIAKSSVSRQLTRLVRSGLVERQGSRNARYHGSDLLLRWLTRKPRNGNTRTGP